MESTKSEAGSRAASKTTTSRGTSQSRMVGSATPLPIPTRSSGRAGARSRGLSSARDRRRLRERSAAERARVEKMLSSVPVGDPVEDPPRPRRRRAALRALPSTPCPICGAREVLLDEVADSGGPAGILRLGECRRCDHRWTERAEPPMRWHAAWARRRPVPREGASPGMRGGRGMAALDAGMLAELPF